MIKVKNTRIHTYPSEKPYQIGVPLTCPVAEGKLVIVHSKGLFSPDESRVNSLLWNTKTNKYERGIQAQNDGMVALTLTESGLHFNGHLFQCKPIVISETEKIEAGDWVYDAIRGRLSQVKSSLKAGEFSAYKILALPQHFSPGLLERIIRGQLKDGDRVLVECECYGGRLESKGSKENWYQIKLSPHITLYPTSKTAEDYKEELRKAIEQGQDYDYNYDGEHEYRVDTFNTEWALEAVMEVVNRIVSDLK